VELRPANLPAPDHVDLLDDRRVQREDALHADPVRDLAHRKRLVDVTTLAGDADTLEDLDPLLVTLAHPDVHTQRVARPEVRDVIPDLIPRYFPQNIHCGLLNVSAGSRAFAQPSAVPSIILVCFSHRSGRRSRVNLSACSRRHAAILA